MHWNGDATMTASCREIGSLVLRVQNSFLDTPGLALTPPRAQRRFGLDQTTCEAVLEMLADAGVLTTTRSGAFVRRFPRAARHAA
jgi:hypothetical protein